MAALRRWAVPAAFVLGLAAWCVARSVWVDDALHPWCNTLAGLVVLGLGFAVGLDRADLGLERRDAARGLAYGAALWAVVALVLVAAAALPATRDALQDDGTIVSTGAMLRRTLIVIPLGTALLEEAAFRGVLLGLLDRVTSAGRALVASAVVFGLWHLLPVWRGGGAGELGDADGAGRFGAVAATFVATFVAGLAFGWLRQRSTSLIAPIAAHLATNSVVFVAAWSLAR